MANVFRSKEVYKHMKYDLHDKHAIVAVQGVYITSEYRPPYYNEPGILIYEISGQHCTAVDFKTEEVNTQGMETAGMYKIDISEPIYSLQRYSIEYKDTTGMETAGMYKIDISNSSYTLQRYEKDYIDTSGMETAGMYKMMLDGLGYFPTKYLPQANNSTPEPILRFSSFTSENCVVENYTS